MNKNSPNVIESLYADEAGRFRALARKRLNDPHEADDLVNEAFRILSERWESERIENPSAFVMTVLNRQIYSHLRKRYRRKFVPIEEAQERLLPSTPDVAEQVEGFEERAMVIESVKAIRSARQQRVLRLTSLNFRPAEIARMETEAGRPATSHQISCVLRRSLVNLRLQISQRGLVRSFLPFLLARRRAHFSSCSAGINLPRFLEGGLALHIVVVVSVAGVLGGRSFGPGSGGLSERAGQGPGSVAASGSSDVFVLELGEDTPAAQEHLEPKAVEGMAPSALRPAASVAPASLSVITTAPIPLNGPSASAAPANPGGLGPKKEFSQSQNHTTLSIQPVPGEELSLSSWQEQGEEPAPPLTDQTMALIKDPDSIPKPECGGLPICSAPEGDDPPG